MAAPAATPAATDPYREYHRPLLALAVRLTGGDRQHAEDVVQETLIRRRLIRAGMTVMTVNPDLSRVPPG